MSAALASEAELGANRYGKANVRMLRVVRDSNRHEVHELTGQMLLEGDFSSAFVRGTNEQVLPTETQKNTLYVLSKKYNPDPLEKWVVAVGKDVLERHPHIQAVNLSIDKNPWQRVKVGGKEHNHAFQHGNDGVRFVQARVSRQGEVKLVSGFKDLAVMKTTQSGFEGFIKDEYTTLKETRDRVMCTKIFCSWSYGRDTTSVDFSHVFERIREMTMERFAGPADTGVYSASVQQTLYEIGTAVLSEFPVIEQIFFALPNIHYYLVDFGAFKTPLTNNNEVFFTFDGAHGQIEATIVRKKPHSRL